MNDFLVDFCLLLPNIALGLLFLAVTFVLIVHAFLYLKDRTWEGK